MHYDGRSASKEEQHHSQCLHYDGRLYLCQLTAPIYKEGAACKVDYARGARQ